MKINKMGSSVLCSGGTARYSGTEMAPAILCMDKATAGVSSELGNTGYFTQGRIQLAPIGLLVIVPGT